MNSTEGTSQANVRKVPLPNNLFRVPTSLDGDFFKWWCTFMRAFVKLTDTEVKLLASILKYRWKLTKLIDDPVEVDRKLMEDKDSRESIIADCGISQAHYHVILSSLRSSGVIVNNRLNPRVIPNIREDSDKFVFQLLVLFKDEN